MAKHLLIFLSLFICTTEKYCKVRKKHKYVFENDKASRRERGGKWSIRVRGAEMRKGSNCQAALVSYYNQWKVEIALALFLILYLRLSRAN